MKRRLLTNLRNEVVTCWLYSGLRDFYISFEFEEANRWHAYSTFFCSLGLEKSCKAYLIGTESARYEKMGRVRALQEVNKIAQGYGHDLQNLLRCLQTRGVVSNPQIAKGIGGYTGGELIQVLENAYREARYPMPNPTYKKYPISTGRESYRGYQVPIGETAPIKYARDVASAITKRAFQDFSVSSPSRFSNKISDRKWRRFRRLLQFGMARKKLES